VGVFIVKAAVQAAVEVTPAMRANFLPAHSTLKFDLFCTGVADPHDRIIHPNGKERYMLKFGVNSKEGLRKNKVGVRNKTPK
jgi:hypothetical protein